MEPSKYRNMYRENKSWAQRSDTFINNVTILILFILIINMYKYYEIDCILLQKTMWFLKFCLILSHFKNDLQ